MSLTVPQLIKQSHQIALEHGWWKDGIEKRSAIEQVCNYHGEISEAWEEYRSNRIDLWWSCGDGSSLTRKHQIEAKFTDDEMIEDGYKPEGFFLEVGDLLIRLGDTMGAYGWSVMHDTGLVIGEHPNFIFGLHKQSDSLISIGSGVWVSTKRAEEICSDIFADCIATAQNYGVDLLSLCELKMKYNASRSYRHGGKRA